jgi:hypothetical protein
MQSALDSAIKETVVKLSKKYNFDYQEALAFLGVEEKLRVTIGTKAKEPHAPKREQPKFPLPFSGQIIDNCCLAVLYNKGLYSQCLNEPCSVGLCSSCSKKAAKTPFGKPEYGTIEARIEQGDEYTDYKGKKPVHFTQIMKKMQLTEEIVLGEVSKFNLHFDTNHFSEPQTKKGRPKKSQETTKAPRPKKATSQIEVSVFQDDDLLETMLEENEMGETPTSPTSPPPTTLASPALQETLLSAPAHQETLLSAPALQETLLSAPALQETLLSAPALQETLLPAPALRVAANPLNLSLKIPEQDDGDISDITDDDVPNANASQKKTHLLQKKAEKNAKKALKEAKEAKQLEEKAKKEEEKARKKEEKAKKEAEKAKKEAEKAKKEAEKAKKEAAKKQQEEAAKKQQEEATQKVSNDELSVEKFDEEPEKPKTRAKIVNYNGKKYIVNVEDNSVYDAETKTEVGYWNPTEKTIVLEEDDEEDDDEDDEEEELAQDSDED